MAEVKIEELKKAWDTIHEFNKLDLDVKKIKFTHDGEVVYLDNGQIEEFRTFGLNNLDMFLVGTVYNWTTKTVI